MAISQRPKTRRNSPSRLERLVFLSLGDRSHEPVIQSRCLYSDETKKSDLDILIKQAEAASRRSPNWIGEKMRRLSAGFKYSPVRVSIVAEALAEDAERTAAKAA